MKNILITTFLIVSLSCTTKQNSDDLYKNNGKTKKVGQHQIESRESVANETKKADSILEKRTAGHFKVVVYRPTDFPDRFEFRCILVTDSLGKQVGKLVFEKSIGDEWSSRSADYRFIDDFNIEVVRKSNKSIEGSEGGDDPAIGVGMETFLHIEDPYEIVGQMIEERWKDKYQINTNGQILQISSVNEFLKNDIYGLERFDILPIKRLRILRNMIFAKLGYRFKSKDLQAFFLEKTWYEPKMDNVDHLLTASDKEIITYITALEDKK